jgi:hypothetical protein
VALKLIYQMFAKLLTWMVLHVRSDAANEIEILVLRHQLAVLQRRTPRPWGYQRIQVMCWAGQPPQPAVRLRRCELGPAGGEPRIGAATA